MIYTLKPISDEQIKSIQDLVMIPISYKAISLDNYIDDIIQKKDVGSHSFTAVRIKKEKKNIYSWIILTLLAIAIAVGIYSTMITDKKPEPIKIKKIESQKTVQVKKEIKPVQPTMISLPDHKRNNIDTRQHIEMLFEVLPYDAILKDIEINKDSSTFVSNFIVTSDSLSDMQSKLKNIYRTSKILLEHPNKVILNTIIQNNTLLTEKKDSKKIQNTKYRKYEIYDFLSTSKATKYLKDLGIKNSIIKFEEKKRNKYLEYHFSVTSKIQSPQEFFTFIEKLNSQKLSINLMYPIAFSRTTKSIEVKYKIQINQQNKKEISLKK